jgi:hypothetical protein
MRNYKNYGNSYDEKVNWVRKPRTRLERQLWPEWVAKRFNILTVCVDEHMPNFLS